MDVQRRSGQIHGQIFHLSLLIFAFGRMRSSNHKQRGSYKLHSTMWLCYFLYPPHIIYITQKYLMDCCPFMSIHEVFVVSRYILHRFSSCRQNKKIQLCIVIPSRKLQMRVSGEVALTLFNGWKQIRVDLWILTFWSVCLC